MYIHIHIYIYIYTYIYIYIHIRTISSKIPFYQTPVGLGTCSMCSGLALHRATQSWQPPAPRESTETGWGAALIELALILASPESRPRNIILYHIAFHI